MSDNPNNSTKCCCASWFIPTKAHKGPLCVERELSMDYLNTVNLATIMSECRKGGGESID